jgi:hypothetical protein
MTGYGAATSGDPRNMAATAAQRPDGTWRAPDSLGHLGKRGGLRVAIESIIGQDWD